jgi:hypothetical protein
MCLKSLVKSFATGREKPQDGMGSAILRTVTKRPSRRP